MPKEPEVLYTLADITVILNSTDAKVRYWCHHADETFVPPAFVAGRNNNRGHFMMFLWRADQLDEVKAKFAEHDATKKRRLGKAKENAVADPKRHQYYKDYRAKKKKEREAVIQNTVKEDLADLAVSLPDPKPKPKPQPIKMPEFTPLAEDIKTDIDDDLDREERALQFLLERGLV